MKSIVLRMVVLMGLMTVVVQSYATNPIFTPMGIKFEYENQAARTVFLKGSFDNWRYRYQFEKTPTGQWELLLPKVDPNFQLKKDTYTYKLLIDGIFVTDPQNPETRSDGFGGQLSVFTIAEDILHFEKTPEQISENRWRFYYVNSQCQSVYLAANFNHFNPYSLPFQKINDDTWTIDVSINEGEYYYFLVVDSRWIIDPRNGNSVRDLTGRLLSYIKIPIKND